jgi:hypothetical protein
VLLLVLAVLMVSYASSMKAYLQQRRQTIALEHDIASSKADIARLRRDRTRLADPAFVKTMAHRRLGFVMPGEFALDVIGADGKPLGSAASSLPEPHARARHPQPQWWQAAWSSDVAAGIPPQPQHVPKPAAKIRP